MKQRLDSLRRLTSVNAPFVVVVGVLALGYWLLDSNSARYCVAVLSPVIPLGGAVDEGRLAWVLANVVPFAAVLCVLKLFCMSWFRTLCGVMTLMALLGVLFCIDEENLSRYVDILYAGLTLVFVSGWVACKLYDFSRRRGAVALGFVGFVLVGIVLYEYLGGKGVFTFHSDRLARPAEILDCVFGVIDKPKDVVEPLSAELRWAFLIYYLFHAMLAFYSGFVAVGFVSKAAVNLVLLRFRRCPQHVFWGVSPEAVSLARSLDKDVVFVFMDPGSRDFDSAEDEMLVGRLREKLDKEGILWILYGAGRSLKMLKSAHNHYFLTSSGADNARLAGELAQVAKEMPDAYVRIEEDTDDARLYQWANSKAACLALNVHIIRESSQVADWFVYNNPLLKDDVFEFKKVSVLLIGFGCQGKMLLNRMICDAQAPGVSFSCDVVDADQRVFDVYEERNRDAVAAYHFTWHCHDVSTKAFFDWLRGRADTFSRIVVATGDDRTNIFVADVLVDLFLSQVRSKAEFERLNLHDRLFVRIRHPEVYMSATGDKTFEFATFGAMTDTYSAATLFGSSFEKAAQRLNASYLGAAVTDSKSHDAVRACWCATSFFNRESSRASILGFRNLLRLCSHLSSCPMNSPAVCEGKASGNSPWAQIGFEKWWNRQVSSPKMLYYLCQAEHNRWNAYHRVRGVQTWEINVRPELFDLKPGSANLRDKVKCNCHAALVAYSDLAEVERWLEVTYFSKREVPGWGSGHVKPLFDAYAAVLKSVAMKPESSDGNCFRLHERLGLRDELMSQNKVVHAVENMLVFWENRSLRGNPEWGPAGAEDSFLSLLGGFADKASANGTSTKEAWGWLLTGLDDRIRSQCGWMSWFCSDMRRLAHELEKLRTSLEALRDAKTFVTTSNLIENDVKVVLRVPDYFENERKDKDG